jgi:hypothetical protein
MPSNWDAKFSTWASPPSQTEQDKCDNAVRAVRTAISNSPALSIRSDLGIFAQGSYRNRTNVRAESDVDIAVLCTGSAFIGLPPGATIQQFGLLPATYLFDHFRSDIGAALRLHFGGASVRTGAKAFEIHENTYRISADVVPLFEFKDYTTLLTPTGVAFLCNGVRIVNYPEQHYSNGVAKNDETGRRFKAIVRILKRLRFEMMNAGIASARDMPSYAIESMIWNVPSPLFGNPALREDLKAAIAQLWTGTQSDQGCSAWKEVNGIKPLFKAGQPWTRDQANQFLYDSWVFAEL